MLVTIHLEFEEKYNEDRLKECVYQYLLELIEADALSYEVEEEEE